jgi:hypothetical protein
LNVTELLAFLLKLPIAMPSGLGKMVSLPSGWSGDGKKRARADDEDYSRKKYQ